METCNHKFKTVYSKINNFDDSKWFSSKEYLFLYKCALCNEISHEYKSIPFFINEINYDFNDESINEYINEKKLILK